MSSRAAECSVGQPRLAAAARPAPLPSLASERHQLSAHPWAFCWSIGQYDQGSKHETTRFSARKAEPIDDGHREGCSANDTSQYRKTCWWPAGGRTVLPGSVLPVQEREGGRRVGLFCTRATMTKAEAEAIEHVEVRTRGQPGRCMACAYALSAVWPCRMLMMKWMRT